MKAEDTSENYLFQLNKIILFVHIVYDNKSKIVSDVSFHPE